MPTDAGYRIIVGTAKRASERGRMLTDAEKLANLKAALMRCDKCEKPIEWGCEVCPHCGYELM